MAQRYCNTTLHLRNRAGDWKDHSLGEKEFYDVQYSTKTGNSEPPAQQRTVVSEEEVFDNINSSTYFAACPGHQTCIYFLSSWISLSRERKSRSRQQQSVIVINLPDDVKCDLATNNRRSFDRYL